MASGQVVADLQMRLIAVLRHLAAERSVHVDTHCSVAVVAISDRRQFDIRSVASAAVASVASAKIAWAPTASSALWKRAQVAHEVSPSSAIPRRNHSHRHSWAAISVSQFVLHLIQSILSNSVAIDWISKAAALKAGRKGAAHRQASLSYFFSAVGDLESAQELAVEQTAAAASEV